MAQHDYNLANQSGADFRADLNNALSAIVTVNSGATAPSTTFAHQLWVDTSSSVLKIRNSANDAWVTTGVSITADNTFAGNLTGNVTGNVTGDVTGNADTATALETARTINGASFDGTANISFGTDSVSEGSSNLYFTNARVESYLDAGTSTPTFASAVINTSLTGSAILDDDTFGTASVTTVATSESIKAYVDSQVGSVDTLAEILLNGNTTGGTDIAFGDNDKAIFGTGSDLEIYHNGAGSFIDEQGTGGLILRGTNLFLRNSADENYIGAISDGSVTLYHNNLPKLATTSSGVDISGTLTSDGLTVDSGSASTTAATFSSDLSNTWLRLESGADSGVYLGSNSGTFRLLTNTTNRLAVDGNGDISFYDDTGTSENLKWDASADTLNFVDNAKATFGASDDLEIYHDGSSSYIVEQGQGSLIIRGGLNTYIQNTYGTTMAAFGIGGAAQLRYTGSTKLQTTNTGIDVTGTVTSDGLTSNGDITVNTENAELQLVDTSSGNTTSILSNNFDTTISADGRMFFRAGGSNDNVIQIASGGDVSFYDDTGSTQGLFWDASAERLGIGTTSPTGLLTVDGGTGVSTSGGTLIVKQKGDTNADGIALTSSDSVSHRIWKDSNGKLNIGSSSYPSSFVQDFTGNIGIGTSSPSEKLSIEDGDIIVQNDTKVTFGYRGSSASSAFAFRDRFLGVDRVTISAAGDVGIGTTSPSEKLEVDGAVLIKDSNTTGTLYLTNTSVGIKRSNAVDTANSRDVEVFTDGTGGNVVFSANGAGSAEMVVSDSGNVGIGTDSPSDKLDVAGALRLTANISYDSNKSGRIYKASNHGLAFHGVTGTANDFAMFNPSGQLMVVNPTGTNDVSLIPTADGNVGIGTTSPSEKLHTQGSTNGIIANKIENTNSGTSARADLILSGDANDVRLVATSSTYTGVASWTDAGILSTGSTTSGGLIFNSQTGGIKFQTATTERMRLDSSGNLLVGKTASGLSTDGAELAVGGTAGKVHITRTSNAPLTLNRRSSDGTIADFRKDGTTVGSISVTASATTYNTSSDARLKDVTGEARGLEVITKLNPVAYNWKADGKADEGLIAQEVKELVPNAVTGSEDEHYQMDYSKLVTHLVKAVQELEQQTIELKKEIANLKGE